MRFAHIFLLLLLSSHIQAALQKSKYLLNSMPSINEPVSFDFKEKNLVILNFLNGDQKNGTYSFKRDKLIVKFDSISLLFLLQMENFFLFVDGKMNKEIVLRPIQSLSLNSKDKIDLIGSWENISCHSLPSRLYFEFLPQGRFVYSEINKVGVNSNAKDWKIYKLGSAAILMTRFIREHFFYIKCIRGDTIETLLDVNGELCKTSFVRTNHTSNNVMYSVKGKWFRIEDESWLPLEIDFNDSVGFQFENTEMLHYNYYVSKFSNRIVLLFNDSDKRLYPDNFVIEDYDDEKIVVEYKGVSAKYKRIH